MANIVTNCFICNQVDQVSPETQTDPKLSSSCGPGLDAKNLLVLFHRALDLIDLGADQSELADQICFCKSCLDELELTRNMLDAFDRLMKIVELYKIKTQLKFLESKGQGWRWMSRKDLEIDCGAAEVRSQTMAGLSSRSTLMTDSSKTPGFFSPVTATKTQLNHFRRQTTPSASDTIFQLPDFGFSRYSSVSSEILNAQPLDMNGRDGILNISHGSGSEATSYNDLDSEQWSSDATTTADASGVKKPKDSSGPCRAIQQISSEEKNPAKNLSIQSNKPESGPRTNERKHKCQSCPAKFKTKNNLTVHLRTHTGEKPYSCTLCPKTFSDLSTLRRHKLVHSGVKACLCRFCPNSFARASDLKRHERVHTGERHYLCTICSKTFPQSNNLVRHMRTHTGEKPFKCTICAKEFADASTLNRHKKTHERSVRLRLDQ